MRAAALARLRPPATAGASAPTVVRSYKAETGNATSGSITLTVSPTAGDLMVVAVGFSIQSARTVAISGWTQVDQITTNAVNNAAVAVFQKVAVGSESSVAYTISGTSDYNAAVYYQVHGQNATTPIDQHSVIQRASTTTPASPSITPAVSNTLALGFVSTDGFHDMNSGVPSGWALDQAAMPALHTCHSIHETTSPTSGVALSFTPTLSGSDNTAIAILTIKP